jgi:hypothetical protein
LGGVAGGISFEKIASFIATYSSVPHTNILNNMVRNLGFKKSHDIKPSITNNKELPGQLPYDKVKKYMDRIEFGFILTQGLTSVDFPLAFLNDNDFYENYKFYHNLPVNKTMKLRDLFNLNNIFQFILYKKSINRIIPNKDDLQTEIRILGMCIKGLFQCATACYALYINGVAHNDLHADNVMMQKTEPTVFRYIFADVRPDIALEYRVVSRYCALIYDWDRAFYVYKGNNPLLEEEYLALANQSNELIEQRDFLKIFCYFYKTLKVDNKIINQYFTDKLLSCICKPKPEGVIFDPINYVTEK